MPAYVIGVDIGTYSAKGVLVNGKGAVVAESGVPYDLSMPRPGWAEHDADGIWWSALTSITRRLLDTSGIEPSDIAAIGTSAIGITMLPLDAEGRPLRPSILYGIDTRCWREVDEIEAALGREAVFERCGKLSVQSLGPKLLWFKKHEPQLFEQTRSVVTASSYLAFRLTGELTIDRYSARGFAPFFDRSAGVWSNWADEHVAPHTMLPRIADTTEVVGQVTNEAAAATGLAPGTPVIAGTTDAAAEALSAGVVDAGDTMLMYGTTLFVIHVMDEPVSHPALWSSTYLRPGSHTVAAGLATSAALTRWFRDEFGHPERAVEADGGADAYAGLAELAAQSPVGSRGLVALPYFSGERTPINDPHARGVIAGLTLSHKRADIYRALLEGVAYALRHNLEVMAKAGGNAARLVAVGGGTKNTLWLQIVSDVLGKRQEVPSTTLGAAYGDAFMAALAANVVPGWDTIREWVAIQRVIEPSAANHNTYEPYYRIFRDLYPETRDIQHRLAVLGASPGA